MLIQTNPYFHEHRPRSIDFHRGPLSFRITKKDSMVWTLFLMLLESFCGGPEAQGLCGGFTWWWWSPIVTVMKSGQFNMKYIVPKKCTTPDSSPPVFYVYMVSQKTTKFSLGTASSLSAMYPFSSLSLVFEGPKAQSHTSFLSISASDCSIAIPWGFLILCDHGAQKPPHKARSKNTFRPRAHSAVETGSQFEEPRTCLGIAQCMRGQREGQWPKMSVGKRNMELHLNFYSWLSNRRSKLNCWTLKTIQWIRWHGRWHRWHGHTSSWFFPGWEAPARDRLYID